MKCNLTLTRNHRPAVSWVRKYECEGSWEMLSNCFTGVCIKINPLTTCLEPAFQGFTSHEENNKNVNKNKYRSAQTLKV